MRLVLVSINSTKHPPRRIYFCWPARFIFATGLMVEPDEIRESTFEKWGEQTCMPVSEAAGASSVYSFAMHLPVSA